MTKRTRLIVLLLCMALFSIITPYIVLYSLGYRVDFENQKIVATGGIYIKAMPEPDHVTIDSLVINKTGLFSNAFFIQNLLPKNHSVLIKKEGYYDYQKNLMVKEKEVTKLEKVILFKKDMGFELFKDTATSPFIQKPSQDVFILENNTIYRATAITEIKSDIALIENAAAYKATGNSLTWLSLDGFLYRSDSDGKNQRKLSQEKIALQKKKTYQILLFSDTIFLKETTPAKNLDTPGQSDILMFDENKKSFRNFYNNIKDITLSPDQNQLLFYNDKEVFISDANIISLVALPLQIFPSVISGCSWLNNDYIACAQGDAVVISETDGRDVANSITLPETITLKNSSNIDIKNPKIIFNQEDKKLYILTDLTLIVSEKLIP